MRRGLTLIELLVVIGILLAVGALVAPVMIERLAERSFDAAADQVRAHLLLARAEAMSRREALEVRFRPDGRVVEIVAFEAGVRAIEVSEVRAMQRSDDRGALELAFDEEARDESVAPWLRLQLPGSTYFARTLPPELAEELEAEAALLEESGEEDSPVFEFEPVELGDPLSEEDHAAPLRLAVYLGDGTTLTGRDVWLLDDGGRRLRLSVNPWTGIPRFEATPAPRPAAAATSPEEEVVE